MPDSTMTTHEPADIAPDHELIVPGTTLVKPPDAQESRVLSISKALDAAYQRASTLALADGEGSALRADFPDDAVRTGANGKAGLLYIEHAYIRERLHDVFAPGSWSVITRRLWTEEYETSKGHTAIRIYADCVMLVRGCYIGEAVGAMSYFPNNAEQNYSDAVEGAQSEALRRIAGKYLGIGLQVWKKGFCEGWKKRHPSGFAPQPEWTDPTQPERTIDDKDIAAMRQAMAAKNMPEESFLKFAALPALQAIPKRRFAGLMASVRNAKKKEVPS